MIEIQILIDNKFYQYDKYSNNIIYLAWNIDNKKF